MKRGGTGLLTLERPRGRGGGGVKWTPIGFSDLNLELSSNQNRTFSTFSLLMSASFDINWMTLSLTIYA